MTTPLDRARTLLEPAALRNCPADDGYLDLLGGAPAPRPTFAQLAMNSHALAAVYERVWRPFAFFTASGITMDDERCAAVHDLRLSDAHRLLDVACGPGNFTRSLSDSMPEDGLAVGFDISAPMLRRAVVDNAGPKVAYVRGDASRLPFGAGAFDAVCCFGALYLVPDPFAVLREMIRVLAPGGRIAVMTTYPGAPGTRRHVLGSLGRLIGVRMFDRETVPDLFVGAGLTELDQRLRGVMQYVDATKPSS